MHLSIAEKHNLEIRADITILTNTPSFGFPTTTFNSTTFGRIRDTVLSGSRKIQMGARLYFQCRGHAIPLWKTGAR